MRDRPAATRSRPALFVLIGAQPFTDWLDPSIVRDRWGYLAAGGSPAGASLLETSVPGVFAVGDVRHGSVKRVASAVGDGALAVSEVHAYLAEQDESRWPARS